MADTALLAAGGGSAPLSYLVPGATSIRIKQIHVKYADNGAGGNWLPAVQIVSDSKHLMGTAADQGVKVTVGSDADVSFFPRVRPRVAAGGPVLDFNIGEIGNRIDTPSGSASLLTVTYQNVSKGDGVLVLAAAPSLPIALAPIAHPVAVFDSQFNTYTHIQDFAFEANPPNVTEGMFVSLYYCAASVADLVVGVDQIEADWNSPTLDRIVSAWSVRHSGGAHTPTVLAATADNDAAAFAAAQVTLVAPNFTPARD